MLQKYLFFILVAKRFNFCFNVVTEFDILSLSLSLSQT